MQFGDCPYDDCEGSGMWPMPDTTPVFNKQKCDECGRVIWLYMSRWSPSAYTDHDFHERFSVDEETKEIKPHPRKASAVPRKDGEG